MYVNIPIELLLTLAIVFAGIAGTWAVNRSTIARLVKDLEGMKSLSGEMAAIAQRVSHWERDGAKLDQVGPMAERLNNLERRIETEMERQREDIKALTRAVQDLALAMPRLLSKERVPA